MSDDEKVFDPWALTDRQLELMTPAMHKKFQDMKADKLAFDALMAKPISPTAPCHDCQSQDFQRHGSKPEFIVVTHKDGCECGQRIHVMQEGGPAHLKWNARKEKPPEVPQQEVALANS